MKFINQIILICLFFCIACHKKPAAEILPEYRFIKNFAQKIKPSTALILYAYGINNNLPRNYELKNQVANFTTDFFLFKTQQDSISLEEARTLLVSVTEAFLQEINSNLEIRELLDYYPFTSNSISISINFTDQNKIDLGNGIAQVSFSKGDIQYERYEIYEYTNRYPAIGKHFTVHRESYTEALELVRNQGALMDLGILLDRESI